MMKDRDTRLVSGKGQFVEDMELNDMAHLAFVGSSHAHAKIVHIDAAKALAMSGVITVITGKEILEHTNPLPIQADLKIPGGIWRLAKVYAMATDRARWFGEPVAAVIAEDERTAIKAADLVEVEYEVLPYVLDVKEAMKPDAPLLYEEWGDNKQVHLKFDFGDVNAAFKEADQTIKLIYSEGRASAFPLEGRAFLAQWEKNTEFLTVWGTFQTPFMARHNIAETLGLPEVKVKTIAADIGGAFGNKIHTYKENVVALASMLTGRPVKYIESQREWFVTGPHQRDVSWEGEIAFKKDGQVLGLKATVTHDLGVESTNKGIAATSIFPACCAVANAYHWKGMHIEGYGIVTNKSFYCAYRGYGKDKGIKFIESALDQVAKKLNMKPEEIRFKNFIQPDEFPYKQINNYTYDSGDYPAVLTKAVKMADLNGWREKQKELLVQGRHIGIGMAFTVEPAGVAIPNCQMGGITQARVKMLYDGTFEVYSDRTEIGQGSEKSHAIIVSDIIGCNIADIYVAPVTSDWIGQGPLSSRGAVYCASAVAKAAKILKEKLLRYASIYFEEAPEDIDTGDGKIFLRNDPEKSFTFKEMAHKVHVFPGPRGMGEEILKAHDHLPDVTTSWYSNITAETGSTYTTFCASADIEVVEVDLDTGITKILEHTHVHDAGKVISKQIVDGQIHGGIVQGIGEALTEELVYDENGILLNCSHADYLMPTALDAPDIKIGHLETPSPFTETGSKGMGEAPIIGGKAVVLSAIEDALSPFNVRVNESPVTREKLRNWILEAQKGIGGNAV